MPAAKKTFPAQTTIFREGDVAEEAFVVMKGAVELFVQRADKTILLGKVSAGQCFGEMGPLSGHPRISGARTLETTDVVVVAGEELRAMLNQKDAIARVIVQALVARLRKFDEDAVQALLPKFSLVSLAKLLLLMNQVSAAAKPDLKPAPRAGGSSPVAAAAAEMSRLPYEKTVEQMAEVLGTAGYRLKDALQTMESVNLLAIETAADGKFLRFRAGELVENAARLEKSLGAMIEHRITAEVELADLEDVARECGLDAEQLLHGLVSGGAARSLFLLRRQAAMDAVRRLTAAPAR
jgi:CRP-like cAMP-binding protein